MVIVHACGWKTTRFAEHRAKWEGFGTAITSTCGDLLQDLLVDVKEKGLPRLLLIGRVVGSILIYSAVLLVFPVVYFVLHLVVASQSWKDGMWKFMEPVFYLVVRMAVSRNHWTDDMEKFVEHPHWLGLTEIQASNVHPVCVQCWRLLSLIPSYICLFFLSLPADGAIYPFILLSAIVSAILLASIAPWIVAVLALVLLRYIDVPLTIYEINK